MNNRSLCIVNRFRPLWEVVKKIFPPFDFLKIYLVALKHKNTILKLQPQSYEDYCSGTEDTIVVVEKACEHRVYEPAYYPNKEGREHKIQSRDIYVAKLNNVVVHGGSGIVIHGNKALTDICSNDNENRILYASGSIKRGSNKTLYVEAERKIKKELDHAVTLCGLSADNYFHLTIEILSRYEYL